MSETKEAIITLMIMSLIIVTLLFISRPQQNILFDDKAKLVISGPDNNFSPSAITYTNKTMHFQVADPYDGYSYWTYSHNGGTQGPSDNRYYIATNTNGYTQYFGYDEFVNHSLITAEVIFRAVTITGTYHFQPLGYFYQKTALESNTHWALAINWDSSGIDLYYNTGNGDTPTSTNLNNTAPDSSIYYRCTLVNYGSQTFIEIQDISTYPTYPIIYSGYITTGNYNASSLYAGFGQYSTGSGDIQGRWDDFTISDTILTYPSNGMGFYLIGAYLDDIFTHTFYDLEEGTNSTLEIDTSITNITLLVQCWLNGTTSEISTITEGLNVIRHNVTVTVANGTIVFSQNNFTYLSGIEYEDSLFWYQYSVQLDFSLQYSTIYTAVVTYEVYY